MKLSEMTTEKAADVMCELAPYVSNIVGDKELLDTLREKIGKNKSLAEIYTYGAKKLAAVVPIVLKTHREDLFSVLAVMNESTATEIGTQNLLVTMNQVREIIQDKDLVDFFGSLQPEGVTE